MKRVMQMLALSLTLTASAVGAQAVDAGSSDATRAARQDERLRIESERVAAVAQHDIAVFGCYQRFAVNVCLEQARVERRNTLAALRRQEHALNDADRSERAADARARIAERQSAVDSEHSAARAAEVEAANRRRVEGGAEKAAAAAARQTNRASDASAQDAARRNAEAARATQAAGRAALATSAAQERERWDQRQRAADERRARRTNDRANAKPGARPLPAPP